MTRRLFVLDPGLDRVTGHHYAACQAVARLSRNENHIFAGTALDSDAHIDNAMLHRVFPADISGYSDWLAAIRYAKDRVLGRPDGYGEVMRLARMIRDILRPFDVGENDHVLLHTMTRGTAAALAEWVNRVPEGRRPRIHVRFIFKRRFFNRDDSDKASIARLKESAPLYLYGEHEELCERLSDRYGGIEVSLLHLVHVPEEAPTPRPDDAPFGVAFIGASRAEKGWPRMPEIVRLTQEKFAAAGLSPPRFVVQALDPSDPMPLFQERIASLRSQGVEVIEDALSNEELSRLLHSIDAMLIPYRRERYIDRGSYVAQDCLAHGVPMVITAGCTIESYVAGGNGIAASSDDEFAGALLAIAQERQAFRERAFSIAEKTRAEILNGTFARRING